MTNSRLKGGKIGIRQLAAKLDVSIGTVSRALNGRLDVNPETRQRVLKAADRLGYVANQSGRSLRQGTTNAVGFVMETGAGTSAHGDTFFMTVFDGMQRVFKQHALDLVVMLCSTEDDPDAYLRRVVARGTVDGLVISATRRIDPRIEFLGTRHIPFVALGRSQSGGDHAWIDLDFEGVTHQAVARLVARGHRRIAIAATARDLNLGFVFIDAYRKALAEHGLPFDPALVVRDASTEAGGYHAADALLGLAERPTAVILANEIMAIGLYRRLHEAGLKPGQDMAVIGFRESPQARFLSPTLTCFRLDLQALGVALAKALLATMPAFAADYPGGPTHQIWPMALVPGESDGRTG